MAAEALLDFPAGHIGIHQTVLLLRHKGGAYPDYESLLTSFQLGTCGGQFLLIKEILYRDIGYITEKDVISHKLFRHRPYLRITFHQIICMNNRRKVRT